MRYQVVRVGYGLIVCAAFVVASGAASAATTTDQQNVINNWLAPTNPATFDAAFTSNISQAQTITVGQDGLLTEIGFQAYRATASGANPTVFVWHASAGSASTAVPQSVHPRYSAAVNFTAFPFNGASLSGDIPVTTFSLGANALPVKAGDVITIGLRQAGVNNNFLWRAGTDAYAGGTRYSKVGTDPWATSGGVFDGQPYLYDAGFRTGVEQMNVARFAPAKDATATLRTGGNYTVADGGFSINVQNNGMIDFDRRGILEFNGAAVPNSADVQAATLTFDVSAMTSSGSEFPSISVYAYAGDGNALPGDAFQTGTLVGASQLVTTTGEKFEVALNAAAIETILASSDYLGLLVIGGSNQHQTGITTNEGAILFETIAPSLTIAYVPEPASLGMVGLLATVGLLRRRRGH